MLKITNLTGSPHQLRTASNENVMLPAFGSVEGEFTDDYVHLLQVCGSVRVELVEPKPDPRPAPDSKGEPSLADQYRELTGKDPDKRWGDKRIQSEIEKLQ